MKTTIAIGLALGVATSVFADDTAELRKQLDDLTARLDQIEKEPSKGGASWTEKITFKGDFRYRFENKETTKGGDKETNFRQRIRARIGAEIEVNDQISGEVRLATGDNKNPTSTNQTLGNYSGQKDIWLDLAYFTYAPSAIEGLDATLGKMKQPWTRVSDLFMDSDVNPEGGSIGYDFGSDKVKFFSQLGYFVMADSAVNDVDLINGQIGAVAKLGDNAKLTLGAGAFGYNNVKDSTVAPWGAKGNSTTAGIYDYDYEVVNAFGKIEFPTLTVPFAIYGDFGQNLANDVDKDTSFLVGASAKYKKFKIDYSYRYVEADAILGALADGDFGGANVKGSRLKLKYNIMKHFDVGLNYFTFDNDGSEAINTDDKSVKNLQLDLMVKF